MSNITCEGTLTGQLQINQTGGSEVVIEPILTEGIAIANYSIDGNPGTLYAPEAPEPSDVEVVPYFQGQALANIKVNNVDNIIRLPEVYGEASGDLITIDDAMQAPAVELSVTLEPQQDLHGYDHPWAGGAGKNKCNAQNPIVLSQAGNIGEQPCAISAGTYTFSWTSSANTAISLSLWNGSTQIGSFTSTFSIQGRGNLTFTITENATSLRCYFNGATTVSDIQVESGSTATSYAPYSNICPISGWTECKVVVSPTEDAEDGTTYTINLGGTYYGGNLDAVQGKLIPYKYYASYNGEALVGPWISSMDVYTPQGTPTTGAQVVDFGAFESEITLTPTQIDLLRGVNNLWSDGEVYVKYLKDIQILLQQLADQL